jgi:hypothetical protein
MLNDQYVNGPKIWRDVELARHVNGPKACELSYLPLKISNFLHETWLISQSQGNEEARRPRT